MKFHKKYSHVGISYPNVAPYWGEVVKEAIVKIEREMWPRYLPLFIKRLIHYMAMGHSVVYIRSRFWYKIRTKLTKGQMIRDIKEKYATLRIMGSFSDAIEKIIEEAEDKCSKICMDCGHIGEDVEAVAGGWIVNLCDTCRGIYKENKTIKS